MTRDRAGPGVERSRFAGEGERLVGWLFVDEVRLKAIVLAGSPTDGGAPTRKRDPPTAKSPLIGMPAPNVTWLVATGLLGEMAECDHAVVGQLAVVDQVADDDLDLEVRRPTSQHRKDVCLNLSQRLNLTIGRPFEEKI